MIPENFTANGKDYEIQVKCDGQELEIRAYHAGHPANGYSYHITLTTAHDLKVLAEQEAVKELIYIAKNDVIEQRYEKLLQSLNYA